MFVLCGSIHLVGLLHLFIVLRRVVTVHTTRFNVFALFPEFVPLIKDGWIGEQMAIAASVTTDAYWSAPKAETDKIRLATAARTTS
jgi:hypothetical protein